MMQWEVSMSSLKPLVAELPVFDRKFWDGARLGRNPRTGDSVHVEEKHIPFFKTGKQLRERLNEEM